jgi:hypothetical protein
MPQNFVAIQNISYKVLTQHMQLNATVMELKWEMLKKKYLKQFLVSISLVLNDEVEEERIVYLCINKIT